jgi:hypothetical protein
MQPDVLESAKRVHMFLLMAYLISIPFGARTGILCAASCIVGILRKVGMPKMSGEYLQKIIFTEDF